MIVNRNVRHNGVWYPKGSKITKSDEYFDVLNTKWFIDWAEAPNEEAEGGSEPGSQVVTNPDLTKAEIIEKLEALGVDHDPSVKKADLLALLEEAEGGSE